MLPVAPEPDGFDFGQQSECDLWSNSTWTWDLLSITAVRQATLHYTPLFITVCQAAMHHQKKYALKSSLTHAKMWHCSAWNGPFLISCNIFSWIEGSLDVFQCCAHFNSTISSSFHWRMYLFTSLGEAALWAWNMTNEALKETSVLITSFQFRGQCRSQKSLIIILRPLLLTGNLNSSARNMFENEYVIFVPELNFNQHIKGPALSCCARNKGTPPNVEQCYLEIQPSKLSTLLCSSRQE